MFSNNAKMIAKSLLTLTVPSQAFQDYSKRVLDNSTLPKDTINQWEWLDVNTMGLKRKFAPRREDSEGEEGPMLMLDTETRRPTRWELDNLTEKYSICEATANQVSVACFVFL